MPATNIKGTSFENVRWVFCQVTPELAADWLKRNRRNRSLKATTVAAYAQDMRNAAWLVTHQCVAFDTEGNLIDGQHRLHAVVEARAAVMMVVSTGWPAAVEKRKTMDAVDRGVQRSLADQLHLQHGVEKRQAARVVQVCNAIAAGCIGNARINKSTTETILVIYALYQNDLKWLLAQPLKENGLGQATVGACLAMARAVWAEKTAVAVEKLITGEGLFKENPILPLRNWLLGIGSREDKALIRNTVFHHLAAFVDGKSCSAVVSTNPAAYKRMLRLHAVRVRRICALYNMPEPEGLDDKPAAAAAAAVNATSPEALKLVATLGETFTVLDLKARVDENAGQWLLVWKNKGWIEPAGVNTFRQTAKFGK